MDEIRINREAYRLMRQQLLENVRFWRDVMAYQPMVAERVRVNQERLATLRRWYPAEARRCAS